MKEADIIVIAEDLIREYINILHIDPYFKIQLEISDAAKISECIESDAPATWILRLNPNRHGDEIDIRLSVVNATLNILFRDVPTSNRLNEALSKLTHSIVELTSADDDGDMEEEEYVED
jgi:hypothetical protein